MSWQSWPFGKFGCFIQATLSEAAPFVSVFTMGAFTFERYNIFYHLKQDHKHFDQCNYVLGILLYVTLYDRHFTQT